MIKKAGSKRLYKRISYLSDKKTRNDFYIFIICLAISVFIWFLIALSNESATTLVYPVKFKNIPPDMLLSNKPDSTLTFRISSGGFELLTLKYLSARRPIEIDLGNLTLDNQNGFYTASYDVTTLTNKILGDYRFSEELVSISPEKLFFQFEPFKGKVVTVRSNLDLVFEKQYRLTDSITFFPAEVRVLGPKHIIEKINAIYTEKKRIEGINGPFSSNCQLIKPKLGEEISLIPDNVEFFLNAEKYTESVISVPVVSGNEQYRIKSFPAKVDVTYLVTLENFSRVEASMFVAVVDPEQNNTSKLLKVELVQKPSFVTVTRIDPAEVEYLLLNE